MHSRGKAKKMRSPRNVSSRLSLKNSSKPSRNRTSRGTSISNSSKSSGNKTSSGVNNSKSSSNKTSSGVNSSKSSGNKTSRGTSISNNSKSSGNKTSSGVSKSNRPGIDRTSRSHNGKEPEVGRPRNADSSNSLPGRRIAHGTGNRSIARGNNGAGTTAIAFQRTAIAVTLVQATGFESIAIP